MAPRPTVVRASTRTIQIQLLGDLRILVDAVDVTGRIKYRKGIGLLALLAVECNILHARERLADIFWPSLSSSAALTNLRQVLSNLSSVLAFAGSDSNPVLRVNSHSVGLFPGPHVDIDVAQVQAEIAALPNQHRLAQAADAGPAVEPSVARISVRELLTGFDLPDCAAYSAWLNDQRLQYADRVITIHEDRAARAAATGNLSFAIDCARRIEQVDPLLERNQVRLMQLLAASGQGERALKQYEQFVQRLRSELDVEPEPATILLRDQIASQRHVGRPAADQPSPRNGDRAAVREPVAVVCAAYGANGDVDGDSDAASRLQGLRSTLAHALQRHGGSVMAQAGLSISAWFTASEEYGCGCHAALLAAHAAMACAASDQRLHIGIYTDMALVAEGFAAAGKLSEIAELAARLSLIAEDRDIVVSASTLRREVLAAESLGEWRFRGLRKPVTVFRLAPSATA